MSIVAERAHSTWPRRLPFYYGWINVVLASLAMTATLPGRTHGLGLITEPLLADLGLERTLYAHINFATSLLGAAFCLPIGSLIDRLGVRITLAGNLLLLAVAVWGMSLVHGPWALFAVLLLIRGLGQSSLSVVSMAMIGKWFRHRLGAAMGIFAVLLTFGFVASVLAMGQQIQSVGWRDAWKMLAGSLLAFLPLAWLLTRNSPESCGIPPDRPETPQEQLHPAADYTLAQALRTPAFWSCVLSASLFNLIWSSITLFNESIVRGQNSQFDAAVATNVMAILTGIGLLSNLLAGAFATRERTGLLLGIALLVLSLALGLFPFVRTTTHLFWYASALGLSGGIVTVIFFSAWGHLFGRTHLGRIQGVAQIFTVIGSAIGPVLMAESLARTGSYTFMFYTLSSVTAFCGIASLCIAPPPLLQASSAVPRPTSA